MVLSFTEDTTRIRASTVLGLIKVTKKINFFLPYLFLIAHHPLLNSSSVILIKQFDTDPISQKFHTKASYIH